MSRHHDDVAWLGIIDGNRFSNSALATNAVREGDAKLRVNKLKTNAKDLMMFYKKPIANSSKRFGKRGNR